MKTEVQFMPKPYNAPACVAVSYRNGKVICVSNPYYGAYIDDLEDEIDGGSF